MSEPRKLKIHSFRARVKCAHCRKVFEMKVPAFEGDAGIFSAPHLDGSCRMCGRSRTALYVVEWLEGPLSKPVQDEIAPIEELKGPRATVVNMLFDTFDVYIGRGSKWGNPFHIGQAGNRAQVIAKYRERLEASPDLLAALPELIGKRLGCYCKPDLCHGDVLAEKANGLESGRRDSLDGRPSEPQSVGEPT